MRQQVKIKNIGSEVMNKIRTNEIKMKPKIYFFAGSATLIFGFITSLISITFIFNIIFFLSRPHGPMKNIRLNMMLTSLPWWVPFVAVISTIAGIYFLKKFDFSYKKNFFLIIFTILGATLLTAWVLDYSGLDDLWFKRGPMYNYFKTHNISPASTTNYLRPGWKNY